MYVLIITYIPARRLEMALDFCNHSESFINVATINKNNFKDVHY